MKRILHVKWVPKGVKQEEQQTFATSGTGTTLSWTKIRLLKNLAKVSCLS